MKMLRFCSLMSLGLVLATVPLRGQEPASATGTGTVTGHVTCGDTQRPARFATVVLFGIPSEVTARPKVDLDSTDQTTLAKAMAEGIKTLGKTNMIQAQTGTDGAYTATDVAPGDYYVFGALAGYVSPLNAVMAAYAAGADMKKQIPGITVVHVTAEHSSTADATLERGAAISGTISWDDGSPLTGAMMAVVPVKGDVQPPTQFGMLAMASGGLASLLAISDDLGHFRLSGLVPGDYLLKATVKVGAGLSLGASMNLGKMIATAPMLVYAPATFHKTDAKTFTLHTSEDLRDQTVTLNLGGLHSVSGRIESVEDHHGINSATVKLLDSQDKEFTRSAPVDAAGNFTVSYVPPGTYTMKVSDAEDTEPKKKDAKDKPKLFDFASDKTLRSYQSGSMSVVVLDSDLTGQNLSLAVDKNPKKDVDLGGIFGDDDDKPAK